MVNIPYIHIHIHTHTDETHTHTHRRDTKSTAVAVRREPNSLHMLIAKELALITPSVPSSSGVLTRVVWSGYSPCSSSSSSRFWLWPEVASGRTADAARCRTLPEPRETKELLLPNIAQEL